MFIIRATCPANLSSCYVVLNYYTVCRQGKKTECRWDASRSAKAMWLQEPAGNSTVQRSHITHYPLLLALQSIICTCMWTALQSMWMLDCQWHQQRCTAADTSCIGGLIFDAKEKETGYWKCGSCIFH